MSSLPASVPGTGAPMSINPPENVIEYRSPGVISRDDNWRNIYEYQYRNDEEISYSESATDEDVDDAFVEQDEVSRETIPPTFFQMYKRKFKAFFSRRKNRKSESPYTSSSISTVKITFDVEEEPKSILKSSGASELTVSTSKRKIVFVGSEDGDSVSRGTSEMSIPIFSESSEDLPTEERFSPCYRWDDADNQRTRDSTPNQSRASAHPSRRDGEQRRRFSVPTKVIVTTAIIAFVLLVAIIAISVIVSYNTSGSSSVGDGFNSPGAKGRSLRHDLAFQVSFHKDPLNFTNAARACHDENAQLMVVQSLAEEKKLMKLFLGNKNLLRLCPVTFLGFRSLITEEWESFDGFVHASGAMFSGIWDSMAYVQASQNCSHASKVLDYRLNNVDCMYPVECVMCETKHGCFRRPPCFMLEFVQPMKFLEAEDHCKRNLRGRLAPVMNFQSHSNMLQVLREDDKKRRCTSVATGLVLRRKMETLDELPFAYNSKYLRLDRGNLNHYCLAIHVSEGDISWYPADCRSEQCYVCRREPHT